MHFARKASCKCLQCGVSEARSGDLVPGAFGNRAIFFKRLGKHENTNHCIRILIRISRGCGLLVCFLPHFYLMADAATPKQNREGKAEGKIFAGAAAVPSKLAPTFDLLTHL